MKKVYRFSYKTYVLNRVLQVKDTMSNKCRAGTFIGCFKAGDNLDRARGTRLYTIRNNDSLL